MKHITLDVDDVPVIPPLMDRRLNPDRRTTWRGGRRDTDWVARPPDAWDGYAAGPGEAARWRRILSSLHIFNF